MIHYLVWLKKYGLTVNELKEFNNLKTDTIKVGQVLKLVRLTHTVVSGDTLYSLAKKHNTTVESLQSINGLKDNLIKVGQVLRLPEKYGVYFTFKDESGFILKNFDYEIELSDGSIHRGTTDSTGSSEYIEIQKNKLVDIKLFAKLKNGSLYTMLAQNNNSAVRDISTGILPNRQSTISYTREINNHVIQIPNVFGERIVIQKQNSFAKGAWDSMMMYQHYRQGNGKAMTLSEMGLANAVKALVVKDGAFNKAKSIQERFITYQVANNDYVFKQIYSWGDELVWAMGEGVLSGEFKGSVVDKGNGIVFVDGVITYRYTDKFTDPYDTFDWFDGEVDIGGMAYDITETWTVKINGIYTKEKK